MTVCQRYQYSRCVIMKETKNKTDSLSKVLAYQTDVLAFLIISSAHVLRIHTKKTRTHLLTP